MGTKDALGDRMKSLYEDIYRLKLPGRMPVILRLDGKAWHTLTRGLKKPVDDNLVFCMNETAKYLCQNIQGTMLAYIQSDEISLLLNSYKTFETQAWLDNNIQKMVSVSASMASAKFTSLSNLVFKETKLVMFDSRAFVLPKEEVNNAFLWRQQDATRNSINMLVRTLYSHKECANKNNAEMQEMCFQKGVNWNDCPTSQKRGRCVVKIQTPKKMTNFITGEIIETLRSEWVVDNEIPIFSQDKNYIERYV